MGLFDGYLTLPGGITGGTDGLAIVSDPNSPTTPKNINKLGIQTYDPNATSTPTQNYYDAYGATSQAEAAARADSLAYLQDQENKLRGQYGRIDTNYNNAVTGIGDQYNKSKYDADLKQARFTRDWNDKSSDSERGRGRALDRVDTGARTLADSLRRRLGMASGADSSTYQVTAPGAVADQATQQRGSVLEDYGVNFRNLAKAKEDNKVDFANMLQDLQAQRQSRLRGAESDFTNQRIGIDESLAEIARQRALAQGGGYDQVRAAVSPYEAQIAQRESLIDGLFNKYRTAYNPKAVRVATPTLRDYMVDRATINAQNEAGTQDPTAYYQNAFNQDEEQLL